MPLIVFIIHPNPTDLLIPTTRRKLAPGETSAYKCADGNITAPDEVGVLPVVAKLTEPDIFGDTESVEFFEVYIVPSWPAEQLLLSSGQLRAPLTSQMNGGWIEDSKVGRSSTLVLNSTYAGGELRQTRCAVEWAGADDRQTSFLVTAPLKDFAYERVLPGSPLTSTATATAADSGADSLAATISGIMEAACEPACYTAAAASAPALPTNKTSALMLHKRTFHAGKPILKLIEEHTTGTKLVDKVADLPSGVVDEACARGKGRAANIHHAHVDAPAAPLNKSAERLNCVCYVDWHVTSAKPDLQQCTGFWSFSCVDENKTIILDVGYPCRSRSQLIESLALLRQEFGTPVTINIDRDTVAVSTGRATFTAFERYCAEPTVDIQVRTSSVGAHWQNNYAELSGKTAQEATSAAMADMNIAPRFASFGISAWYYLADKLPRPDLNNKSRFELRNGTLPSSFEWKRPYCPALVYVPRSQRGKDAKFQSHIRRCVFLDYARGQQQPAYTFFDLDRASVFTSRDIVHFDEEARMVKAGPNFTWRWSMDAFDSARLKLAAEGEADAVRSSESPEVGVAPAGVSAPSLGLSKAPGGVAPVRAPLTPQETDKAPPPDVETEPQTPAPDSPPLAAPETEPRTPTTPGSPLAAPAGWAGRGGTPVECACGPRA